MQTAIFFAVVALALVTIYVAGRSEKVTLRLAQPSRDGLLPLRSETDPHPELITWPAVYRITLIMKRRLYGSPRYVFEILAEGGGTLYVKGESVDAAERLLAESHQLPGFDHETLVARLSRNDSTDVVIFNR